MRTTLASIAILATLASCEFAIKHPAATVGIVGGVVAAGTCEIGTDGEHVTCAAVTAGAGLGLAAIVWLAMLLGGDGNTILHGPDPEDPPAPEVPQDPTLDQPRRQVPQDPTLDQPPDPAPVEPAGPPATTPPTP